jgi:peptide/nickel transport system substrate-binding protein
VPRRRPIRARLARFVALVATVGVAVGITGITAVTAGARTVPAGAVPAGISRAAAPKPGGSVTYGLEAETAGGWCPSTARLAISGIEVGAAIYDTLTVPNSKGEIVPYLAKSVDHDATYQTWTIKLRDGIKFHDGTPLDAAAVVQNINAYRASLLVGSGLKDIDTVTATDPSTVTVTTKVPWIAFPWFLYLDGRFLIVAPAQLANPDTCPSNLIGTGPFKLDHWTVNQELVANRNPDYWQKDAKGTQLPYLDTISFKPVKEAVQRVNSLQGGQLDIIHTSDGQQVDALQQLASKFNEMYEKPGRSEVRYYLMNVAKAPLDDPDARKAVALAIDRTQINELRNSGVYRIADGPFDSKVPGYVKKTGYPKFNLKEATKLASAYKAAHGGSFSVVLEHTDDPANTQEAELIKQQLSKAGIDATLKQDDQTAFILAAVSGNFSIMLWRNHPGDDPDVNYQWWQTGSLLNFGKFADPDLQALIVQGRSELDPTKRTAIYQQVDRRFASQLYNVWAYYSQWMVATKKNVQGLMGPPLPDGGGQPLFLYGRHPLLGIYVTK